MQRNTAWRAAARRSTGCRTFSLLRSSGRPRAPARSRQDDVAHAQRETRELPKYEEPEDKRDGGRLLAQLCHHAAAPKLTSLPARTSTIKLRSRWFNATNAAS